MNTNADHKRELARQAYEMRKQRNRLADRMYNMNDDHPEYQTLHDEEAALHKKICALDDEIYKLDPWTEIAKIPMDQCKKGRVYKIHSRNLNYGVYDGDEGFIGIRSKFGSLYLFTEYHHDQGPPFGTVSGQQDTGIDVPDGIPINECGKYDTVDQNGRGLYKDKTVENPMGYAWKGWYRYADTNELCPKLKENGFQYYAAHNDELFQFLKQIEWDNGRYFPPKGERDE